MPPSPIVTVSVKPDRLLALVVELRLKAEVDVKVWVERQGRTHGYWEWKDGRHKISIFAGAPGLDVGRLTFAATAATDTLLHELRHAWQYENWTDDFYAKDARRPYSQQELEKDANEWASTNAIRWRGLVHVSRRFPNSGFSRLSAAAERSR